MATTLSSPLADPGGCLICQRLALAVVLVDLANTSKEIIPCFSITARFAGPHRSLRPDTARLPVQSVPVAIRQRRLPENTKRLRISGTHTNLILLPPCVMSIDLPSITRLIGSCGQRLRRIIRGV